jgi:DNA ligase D-like protein (predicted 3'-phosphoesterase)
VLKSWAIPKGPSLAPKDKRLAVQVADHALEYGDFEGVIAEGEYGAGAVIVWDTGTYRNLTRDRHGLVIPMHEAIAAGRVEIWLEGRKIRGGYTLVRTQLRNDPRNWLLNKMADEAADSDNDPVIAEPESALTGRTVEEVAKER